jgi:3-methyladenine DNA glycosylase/8-oxoguanine DNA glycosylase
MVEGFGVLIRGSRCCTIPYKQARENLYYDDNKRPAKKEMLQRGELWRPYWTFATWYMWGVRRLAQRNDRERTRIVSL